LAEKANKKITLQRKEKLEQKPESKKNLDTKEAAKPRKITKQNPQPV
jgi:hypothetical protein